MVPLDDMRAFVSAQVYAARAFSAATGQSQDHWGFAWQPNNETAIVPADFTRKTAAILDRLAMAIRDSGQSSDPNDPGGSACGPTGQNFYCGSDVDGARFAELWRSFRTWSEPVLTFSTPPQTIAAGTPSAPITLSLATSSGSPRAATAPIAVTLTSSSAQGQLSLSSSGPWTSTLAVTIPAASSSAAPFYYLDTHAAHPQLRATALGVTTATQLETVGPGPPISLRIDPTSATLEPHWSHLFKLVSMDAYGNLDPVQAQWSVTPTSLATVEPETGSTTMLTAGGRRGTGRLTATVAGVNGEITATAILRVKP
jgi:hypothetical protein